MPEWLDVAVRSVIFLVFLFFVTKVLGKKQIAQLSFFEYVTGITIGSIAAEGIMGLDGNMYLGMIAIVIVALIPFLSGLHFFKKQKISRFYRRQGDHIHKRRKSSGRQFEERKIYNR